MSITHNKVLSGAGIRPLRMMGDVDLKVVIGNITFDSAYLTAGESLAPSDVGLTQILYANFTPLVSGSGSAMVDGWYAVNFDYTNSKAQVLIPSGDREAVSGTNLSTHTCRFIIIGL